MGSAVKKVLLAHDLEGVFMEKNSFLDRDEIAIFTAATNDELLDIHRWEVVDLIVTQLDMPGIRTEELFRSIRTSEELREVLTILICPDSRDSRERCRQCNANAVVTLPIDTAYLRSTVQQFLEVTPRDLHRAEIAVAVQGKFKNRALPFRTVNVSAGGMLIKSQEPLSKGEGIFFSFTLPDGTPVSGYGEIARVAQMTTTPHAFVYGIKFSNLDQSAASSIEAAVTKYLR
jgi:CheY-like chemotaxis protein